MPTRVFVFTCVFVHSVDELLPDVLDISSTFIHLRLRTVTLSCLSQELVIRQTTSVADLLLLETTSLVILGRWTVFKASWDNVTNFNWLF